MNNLSLKQYKRGSLVEIDEFGYESKVVFNPIDYYKLFFNQKVKDNGLKVDKEYYVRGFGNIDNKVFISFYKSYNREELRVAYRVQEHQENLFNISKMIDEEY